MFELLWPYMLLLAPLPLFMRLIIPAATQEEAALRAPFFDRAKQALGENTSTAANRRTFRLLALALIWGLLVLASARPTWLGEPISLPTSARDLLVAVDISGSMSEEDMVVEGRQIPRIVIVKYVVGDFLKRRENDRLGLILFGSNAYLQAPLTFDRSTVNQLLQEAQLGFAGRQTAIGDAIGLSIKRLKDRPDAQRVVILLTDGANTAGEVDPRQAADLAKQAGVKIYTVGIGAEESVRYIGPFAQRVNPSADLDEGTLQYIADTTGGQYFRARNPEELETIYQTLDRLEPIEQDAEVYRPQQALYFWPLGAAFVLSFFMAALSLMPQSRIAEGGV